MRLSRYSIIGIMAVLLLSAVAIMPVFGAVTGTISVDKAYVAPGGTATVTVDDADLNTLLARTNIRNATFSTAPSTIFFDLADSAGQTGSGGSGFGTGTATGDEIAGTPVIANITDSAGGVEADYSLTVFNKATGRIFVTYGGPGTPGAATATIEYNLARVNTTSIDVVSPSDSTGIHVDLIETGANTGIFKGNFNVVLSGASPSSDTTDTILAVAGQSITVRYNDASPAGTRQASVAVESTKPVGSLVGPANGSITATNKPVFTVDFTDNDSGVQAGTIAVVIDSATAVGLGDQKTVIQNSLSAVTTTAITNGFQGTTTASAPKDTTIAIMWHAEATDAAGNMGRTDADVATAGDQNYVLYIDQDAPDFATATISAGTWFDTTTNKVVTDTSKSLNSVIGIMLPDLTGSIGGPLAKVEQLNAGTVTAADFEIDTLKQTSGVTLSDVTPSAANVYSSAPNWIFLTVPAMAADAQPTVNLLASAGGISDSVGNTTTSGSKVADDRQAPKPTYSLNKTLDKTSITVSVTTNEPGGVPVVQVLSAANPTTLISQTVTLVGTNQYQAVLQRSIVGNGPASLVITVPDSHGNSTVLGSATVTADFPESNNIAIYFDNLAPAPALSDITVNNVAAQGASVEISVPFFITANFAGEGAEFGLDSLGKLTVNPASVVDDLDIHNTVTVSSVTLDGTSLISMLDTQDNVTFNLAINDITVGAHTLHIMGTDQAGNEYDSGDISFTVTARKPYEVAMNAGWNLISFPGTPVDTDIDDVLPPTHPATDVLTYDDGVWSVGTRSSGGTWEGTLTMIDGRHGYWVNTTSGQPIKTLLALPNVGSAATLPSIPIEQGWNLVSVIDLSQTKQDSTNNGGADSRTASNYFTSVDWSVAYTYNSSTRTWQRVTASDTTPFIENGEGVWLWANADGTLVP